MNRRKNYLKNRKIAKVSKLITSTVALAPLALAAPILAEAIAAEPVSEVKTPISMLLTEPLLAGDSITFDLDEIFYIEETDEVSYDIFVQNGSIANVTILSGELQGDDLLHIGAKRQGTTFVELIADYGNKRVHERFRLNISENAALNSDDDRITIDDIMKYIHSHPNKFVRVEDYRNLLQAIDDVYPRENTSPVIINDSAETIHVGVGESKVLDMNFFFRDEDGDELQYTLYPVSGSFVSAFLEGDQLTVTGNYYANNLMTFSVAASDDGVYFTSYKEFKVKVVDELPPSIQLSANPLNPTNNDVTVTVLIEANGSEISELKWLQGQREVSDFLTAGELIIGDTFNVSENGLYTVYARDEAGNKAVQIVQVNNIDKTPPTVVVTGQPEEVSYEPITLTFTATDDDSGLQEMQVGSQEWLSIEELLDENGSYSYDLLVVSNGIYTVSFKDKAGNIETKEIEINKLVEVEYPVPIFTEYSEVQKINVETNDGIIVSSEHRLFNLNERFSDPLGGELQYRIINIANDENFEDPLLIITSEQDIDGWFGSPNIDIEVLTWGTTTIELQAKNSAGQVATGAFSVKPNEAPYVIEEDSMNYLYFLKPGDVFRMSDLMQYSNPFADYDQDVLTYTAEIQSGGTGAASITPLEGDFELLAEEAGEVIVHIIAYDGAAETGHHFTIKILGTEEHVIMGNGDVYTILENTELFDTSADILVVPNVNPNQTEILTVYYDESDSNKLKARTNDPIFFNSHFELGNGKVEITIYNLDASPYTITLYIIPYLVPV